MCSCSTSLFFAKFSQEGAEKIARIKSLDVHVKDWNLRSIPSGEQNGTNDCFYNATKIKEMQTTTSSSPSKHTFFFSPKQKKTTKNYSRLVPHQQLPSCRGTICLATSTSVAHSVNKPKEKPIIASTQRFNWHHSKFVFLENQQCLIVVLVDR